MRKGESLRGGSADPNLCPRPQPYGSADRRELLRLLPFNNSHSLSYPSRTSPPQMPPKRFDDPAGAGSDDDSFESEEDTVAKGKKGKDKQVRRRSSKACTYVPALGTRGHQLDELSR